MPTLIDLPNLAPSLSHSRLVVAFANFFADDRVHTQSEREHAWWEWPVKRIDITCRPRDNLRKSGFLRCGPPIKMGRRFLQKNFTSDSILGFFFFCHAHNKNRSWLLNYYILVWWWFFFARTYFKIVWKQGVFMFELSVPLCRWRNVWDLKKMVKEWVIWENKEFKLKLRLQSYNLKPIQFWCKLSLLSYISKVLRWNRELSHSLKVLQI